MFIQSSDLFDTECNELHIGNTPRSIMTKGNSVTIGTRYRNFVRGNKDKLMISYRRERSHDYLMEFACGVLFEGEIHFFGGYSNKIDITRQHFVIETQRSGQLVKMMKKEDLEIGFSKASCSSFEITSEYFPWFKTNVVILCFDYYKKKSCYSFDGKLNGKLIGDSNYEHNLGGLTKYESNLLTVGGVNNQNTEIMQRDGGQIFGWSIVDPDFKFTQAESVYDHSMVTVESSDINEEYVLLIGGDSPYKTLENVFKFNGTWFPFGELNKPRYYHNSIYWNGAVYVIGGAYGDDVDSYENTKIEIWNIKDSPDQFKTIENWPEVFDWEYPHLFIVADSFFPDH